MRCFATTPVGRLIRPHNGLSNTYTWRPVTAAIRPLPTPSKYPNSLDGPQAATRIVSPDSRNKLADSVIFCSCRSSLIVLSFRYRVAARHVCRVAVCLGAGGFAAKVEHRFGGKHRALLSRATSRKVLAGRALLVAISTPTTGGHPGPPSRDGEGRAQPRQPVIRRAGRWRSWLVPPSWLAGVRRGPRWRGRTARAGPFRRACRRPR